MAKKQLSPGLEAHNVFIEFTFDNEPSAGYTTSVHVRNTATGPLITFIGVGITPSPPEDIDTEPDELFPRYSRFDTITKGQNEAGVTARVLKQLNITSVKQRALEELRKHDHAPEYLPLDIAIDHLIQGLEGRTQTRDDKFKANLAAAYIEQIRKTGSKGVYEELGGKLGYSPHTLRSYVKQIRDQGFLTSTVRGVAGGDLTEKTREILGIGSGD